MTHEQALLWFDHQAALSQSAVRVRMFHDLARRARELETADDDSRLMLASAAFSRAVVAEMAGRPMR